MPNDRRQYDEEFKRRVVQLSYGRGRTVKSTAENLGIHESVLYRWRKRYTPDGEVIKASEQDEELRSLRRKFILLPKFWTVPKLDWYDRNGSSIGRPGSFLS